MNKSTPVKKLTSSSVTPVRGGVKSGLRAGITVNKAKTAYSANGN
jgi:hypothetical protein